MPAEAVPLADLRLEPSDLSRSTVDVDRLCVVLQSVVHHLQAHSDVLGRMEEKIAASDRMMVAAQKLFDAVDQEAAAKLAGRSRSFAEGVPLHEKIAPGPRSVDTDVFVDLYTIMRDLQTAGVLRTEFNDMEQRNRRVMSDLETKVRQVQQNKLDKAGWHTEELIGQVATRRAAETYKTQKEELQSWVDASLGQVRNAVAESLNTKLQGFEKSLRLSQSVVRDSIATTSKHMETSLEKFNRSLAELADGNVMLQGKCDAVEASGEARSCAMKYLFREALIDLRLLYTVLGFDAVDLRGRVGEGITEEMRELEEDDEDAPPPTPGTAAQRRVSARDVRLASQWKRLKETVRQRRQLKDPPKPGQLSGYCPAEQQVELWGQLPAIVRLRDATNAAIVLRMEEVRQEITDTLATQLVTLTKEVRDKVTAGRVRQLLAEYMDRRMDSELNDLRQMIVDAKDSKASVEYVHSVMKAKADSHRLEDKADKRDVEATLQTLRSDIEQHLMHSEQGGIFKRIFHQIHELHGSKLDVTDPTYTTVITKLTDTGFLPPTTACSTLNSSKCLSCARPTTASEPVADSPFAADVRPPGSVLADLNLLRQCAAASPVSGSPPPAADLVLPDAGGTLTSYTPVTSTQLAAANRPFDSGGVTAGVVSQAGSPLVLRSPDVLRRFSPRRPPTAPPRGPPTPKAVSPRGGGRGGPIAADDTMLIQGDSMGKPLQYATQTDNRSVMR